MPKHKTVNEDIIDLLKHGSYDYLELVEYAESQGHDKFHNFEFGYRDQDCANFAGNIKLFPFFHYTTNFRLIAPDKGSTKVIISRNVEYFQGLRYYSPTLLRDVRTTKITCRNHFISRIKSWDKFIDSSKLLFLENTERYMNHIFCKELVDDINVFLNKYHFTYNVSMGSMLEDYEKFKTNLDENMEMIKNFTNPCVMYQEEE